MKMWNNVCTKVKDVYNAAISKQSLENSQQYTDKLNAIKELKRMVIRKHVKALRQELSELDALEHDVKILYNQQCAIETTREKQKRLLSALQEVNIK